uniref:Uncharacterized protein n=1 Tax=Oryza brachyantha TaxID=4533 RepID=J3MW77_ORYBR
MQYQGLVGNNGYPSLAGFLTNSFHSYHDTCMQIEFSCSKEALTLQVTYFSTAYKNGNMAITFRIEQATCKCHFRK